MKFRLMHMKSMVESKFMKARFTAGFTVKKTLTGFNRGLAIAGFQRVNDAKLANANSVMHFTRKDNEQRVTEGLNGVNR